MGLSRLQCDLALVNPVGFTADKSKLGLSIPYGIDFSPQLYVIRVILWQMAVQLQGHMAVMQCTGTHVCVIFPELVAALGGQFSVGHDVFQLSARWHCNAHSMGITVTSIRDGFIYRHSGPVQGLDLA